MQEQRGLRKLIDAYLVQTASAGVGETIRMSSWRRDLYI